jgi:hypothetical protein
MYFVEVLEVPRRVMERERERRTDVESSRGVVLEKILRFFVFMRMSASITSHVFEWSIGASYDLVASTSKQIVTSIRHLFECTNME